MSINIEATLGDLVIEDPRRITPLERLGLDYCCGGNQSLREAVAVSGGNLDAAVAALTIPGEIPTQLSGPTPNAALAHDIVDTHHSYMWEEMPRLLALVEKVNRVHGSNHPELAEVEATFAQAVAELDPHMTREERQVFPLITKLEKGERPQSASTIAETIDELVQEHVLVGKLFEKLSDLTRRYLVPADACTSYRLMLTGLQEMQSDLHEHIHKENNILFPQALQL